MVWRQMMMRVDAQHPEGGLPLTDMQRKVVRLCSLGCTAPEVAYILGLRPATVENHKARAMARLGATNLAMLTRCSLEDGVSHLADRLTPEEELLLQEYRNRQAPKDRPGGD